jgi:transmembrane sensor
MANAYLEDLLGKYIAGTISEEERVALFASLEASGNTEEWKTLLKKLSEATVPIRAYDALEWEPVLRDILSKRPPVAKRVASTRHTRVFRRQWRAAAAILLVSATSAYFLLTNNHPGDNIKASANSHLQNDVAPGGNRAVLTLANGQKIILDSTANGSIARQGNTKIAKINNSQLAYNTLGPLGEKPSDRPTAILYNTLTTPRGGQYQITLSDGTKVWLNAASSIKYPTVFSGKERIVDITGEAYLEVVHNPRQPFLVRVRDQVIEDMGTAFDINAYTDEPVIKATLVQGAVRVNGVPLRPGQQAIVVGNQMRELSSVDIEQVLAWKNGLFSFTDADVYTVMRELARWYNVDVRYEGDIPQHEFEFNGEIGKSLTLSQVLDVLAHSRVHYTIEGDNRLIIRP